MKFEFAIIDHMRMLIDNVDVAVGTGSFAVKLDNDSYLEFDGVNSVPAGGSSDLTLDGGGTGYVWAYFSSNGDTLLNAASGCRVLRKD